MRQSRRFDPDRPASRWPIIGVALLAACADPPQAPPPPDPPTIEALGVAANPDNVLSAVVTARVRAADSVVVRFQLGEGSDGENGAAPALGPVPDSVSITVLGLRPASRYAVWVVAYGPGGNETGDTLVFATDTLPADLPRYAAGGPDPSSGYVAFAAGRYGLVIDNSGRVVWYHEFPNGPGLNFQAQQGRYYARPATPDVTDRDLWIELDPSGVVTRSLGCARDLQPRFHDIRPEPDGSYWVMCDETRTMDLVDVGGVADAQVTGTVVQHLSAAGDLLFEWSPFDHFAITDLPAAGRTGPRVNWTHGNALDFDADGSLVVSFRSLSEITKIDTRTGAVVWRMGGLRNQFGFQGTGMPAFAWQHGLRLTGPGRLVLLDNLGDPSASRAERYAYDETARTAQLVGSYGSYPAVIAKLGGTTQLLPGGHTLVAYGSGNRVEEYDANGNVVWRIEGNPGYVFRAQRIGSLYRPGVGMAYRSSATR